MIINTRAVRKLELYGDEASVPKGDEVTKPICVHAWLVSRGSRDLQGRHPTCPAAGSRKSWYLPVETQMGSTVTCPGCHMKLLLVNPQDGGVGK